MKSAHCSLTVIFLVTSIVFHLCHAKNRYQGKEESCRRAPGGSDLGEPCQTDPKGREEGLKKYDREHQTEYENEDEIYEYDSDDDDFDDWDDNDDDDHDKGNSEMASDEGKLREDKKDGRHTEHERREDKSKSDSAKTDSKSSKGKTEGKQMSEHERLNGNKYSKKDERKGNEKHHESTYDNDGRTKKEKRTGEEKTKHESKASKKGKVAKTSKSKREPDTKGDRRGPNSKEGKRQNGIDKHKKEKNADHDKNKHGKGKHSKHGEHTSDNEASSQETFPVETEEKYANHAQLPENDDKEASEEVLGTEGTGNEETVVDIEADGSIIEKARDTSTEGITGGSDETDAQGDNINSCPPSYTEAPEGTAAEHTGEGSEVNTDRASTGDIKVDSQTEFTTKPDDATIREFLTVAMEFDSTIMMEEHMRVGKPEEEEEVPFEKNGWEWNLSGGRGVAPEVSTEGIQEENSLGDGSVFLEASSDDVTPLPEVSAEYVTSPDAETGRKR